MKTIVYDANNERKKGHVYQTNNKLKTNIKSKNDQWR